MAKKDHSREGKVSPLDWDEYERGSNELYSYLKKKGKHRKNDKDKKK